MFMIFRPSDNCYYNSRGPEWTIERKQASKYNTEKAIKNVIENNKYLKENKDCLLILEENDNALPLYTKEEAEQYYEELREAAQAFAEAAKKIDRLKKYYSKELQTQNNIQEDLLHKFEFTGCNHILFVKLGRMLNQCRQTRREAKDRLKYLEVIADSSSRELKKELIQYEESIENRAYKPRSKEGLFDEKGE